MHGDAPRLWHKCAPVSLWHKGSWRFRRSARLHKAALAHQLKDLGLKLRLHYPLLKRTVGQRAAFHVLIRVPAALGHVFWSRARYALFLRLDHVAGFCFPAFWAVGCTVVVNKGEYRFRSEDRSGHRSGRWRRIVLGDVLAEHSSGEHGF